MKIIPTLALLAAMAMPTAANAAEVVNQLGRDTEVCDVCLIYSGAARRPVWDVEHLTPYITHEYSDGRRDWFYDAFLFNEFDWDGYVLANQGAGQKPALQKHWIEYLDHFFEEGHDLPALDAAIEKFKEELGEPRMRHKVIIGLAAPAKDGTGSSTVWKDINWGSIDGTPMNFARKSHRQQAANWFVDQVIDRFEKANFKNIDLAGFYWIEESLYSNGDIISAINVHIHQKGYRAYWIPYWDNNDRYATEWKSLYRFDMAWRQPNYYFYDVNGSQLSLPSFSRLEEAIENSRKYGLGLELEFETQARNNGLHEVSEMFHQRLIDYIDEFERLGVWDDGGVAHYSGTQGFYHMHTSTDAVNHATIDRLASLVAKRQEQFAGVEAPITDSLPFAYAGQGEIFITSDAPNAVCYNTAGIAVHTGAGRFTCPPGLYIVTDGQGRSSKLIVK